MTQDAMIEHAAELISDYVAWRRWANMAEDKCELREKMREGDFDVNEPTKYDCREAARAVVSAYNPDERLREALEEIAKLELVPKKGASQYLIDYWETAFTTVRDMARSALSPLPQGDDT
jgi:hypothetical protein